MVSAYKLCKLNVEQLIYEKLITSTRKKQYEFRKLDIVGMVQPFIGKEMNI
jgi:hypothetical protein